jgi:hypothetical protein
VQAPLERIRRPSRPRSARCSPVEGDYDDPVGVPIRAVGVHILEVLAPFRQAGTRPQGLRLRRPTKELRRTFYSKVRLTHTTPAPLRH